MYSLGGRPTPPPLEKALENSYRVEMHVHSPNFQGQLIGKKIRSITFIVWVLGRVEKNDHSPVYQGQLIEKKIAR